MSIIKKMDEMADKVLIIEKQLINFEKKLFLIVFDLGKSFAMYIFLSSVYLGIYYSQGIEVVGILLAVGVVYFGLKQKSSNAVMLNELKKFLKEEKNERGKNTSKSN